MEAEDRRILSPFVAAELDYLIRTRFGPHAERAFLSQVALGVYRLATFSGADLREALEVIESYGDLNPGLADASLVVLSRRLNCLNLLTLDERHFRVLNGAGKRPFRILPTDRD